MTTSLASDPRLVALLDAGAALTAPGQPFEMTEGTVLGEQVAVFRHRPRSLRQVLIEGSARFGQEDCYVFDGGRRISFVELERLSASLATSLRDRFGVAPGDRVAICAANCPEWLVTFWAVASLGAVLVAMNGWWTGTEMANALALTSPSVVVMDTKRLARLEGGDAGAPVVVIEEDMDALLGAPDAPLPDQPIAEDDPFLLIFTSGTTGRPKAAALSHRSVIGYLQLQSFIAARGLQMAGVAPGTAPGAVRLAPYPLFHVSGVGMAVATVMGGTKSVWPLGRFEPERVIDLTLAEGVSVWGGGTTHVIRLLASPAVERVPPEQLRQIGVGGSATTPELLRQIEARFPHLANTTSTGYGSTETGGLVSWAPNWLLRAAAGCVGPVLPTVEVRITDDQGQPLPDGTEGNVEARSFLTMLGYWENDVANERTIRPGRWIATGDYGRFEDGLLFIASRRGDLIIRGGENIYPFEIEDRLEAHPDVLEAAVFGVDDPVYGQVVKAVVVTIGTGPGVDELRAFCAEALASYKVPATIEVRTEPLPRNATGKVMKHVLSGQAGSAFVEDD